MKTLLGLGLSILLVISAGGCVSNGNMPLVFGQSQVVGISVTASSVQQDIDFTLGYKDINIAVVPVTVKQPDGSITQLNSRATADYTDALSVIGQFELNTQGKTVDVGLGKFFATGLAAKRLADGFAGKLKQTKENEENK